MHSVDQAAAALLADLHLLDHQFTVFVVALGLADVAVGLVIAVIVDHVARAGVDHDVERTEMVAVAPAGFRGRGQGQGGDDGGGGCEDDLGHGRLPFELWGACPVR